MKKFLLSILFWLIKIPAKIIIFRFKPQIIAVTGSFAKSSTKEAIFQILKTKFKDRIGKNWGNLNNELGLPLAIIGFKKSPFWLVWPLVIIYSFFKSILIFRYPQILVLEYAADKPGDLKYLISIARPDIGVITALGIAHIEFFKSKERIYQEKGILVESLAKDGFAVLNKNDPGVVKMNTRTKAKVLFFSPAKFDIPQQAARTVSKIFKIDDQKAKAILKNFKPLEGRFQILAGKKGIKIINDTYNSNPESAEIALEYLTKLKGKRKVAILGDMLELGIWAQKAHLEIGKKARHLCDFLVTVGKNSKIIKNANLWYPDWQSCSDYILNYVQKGDIILVKGSRKMKMEKIVEKLL